MEPLAAVAAYMELAENVVLTAIAVFVRISAIAFFLPGFGERTVPSRVRLGAALAFAAITWPMVMANAPALEPSFASLAPTYAAEAMVGLMLGLGVRLMIIALQTAGAIAAQSLSISQLFSGGVAPEPEPTMATLLTLGGIALAFSLGMHIKIAALLVESYDVLPFGVFPVGGDLAAWSAARVGHAFALAVSLALPFIMMAFLYNVAIGLINRAMPQLMVAFVGLPAITGLGLLLLMLTAGAMLRVWHDDFDAVLRAPLAT